MQTIIITLNNGKKEEYVKGIKVKEILNKMSKEEREDAILIKYNNKKVNLETELKKNGTLQIYDINTLEGNRIYERGLLYLFVYVTNNILEKDTKVIVKHSIDKGIFCKIDKKVEDKDVLEIKKQMKEIVSKNIPFTKMDTTKYEAIEYIKSIKREDKAKTLFYDRDDHGNPPDMSTVKAEISPSTIVTRLIFNQNELLPLYVNDLVDIWYKGKLYSGYIADRVKTEFNDRLIFVESWGKPNVIWVCSYLWRQV